MRSDFLPHPSPPFQLNLTYFVMENLQIRGYIVQIPWGRMIGYPKATSPGKSDNYRNMWDGWWIGTYTRCTRPRRPFPTFHSPGFPSYYPRKIWGPNRLSSTIGGNREMVQLYTTLQVSNITRKTKFSHIIWHVFKD